jgi:hypothetical protein
MRPANSNEIEYLGAMEGVPEQNRRLIREMARQLDALRRFEQRFFEADCHPRTGAIWHPDSPIKAS